MSVVQFVHFEVEHVDRCLPAGAALKF